MSTYDERISAEVRKRTRTYERRIKLDRLFRYVRSCAVCSACVPPIDFLCEACWRRFPHYINRGAALRQSDYVIPTYSLFTWTPASEHFVRPLIYGFKRGFSVEAAERLALLFLTERSKLEGCLSASEMIVVPPALTFDHGLLWGMALGRLTQKPTFEPFSDASQARSQKRLKRGDRAERRYGLREHFANCLTGDTNAKSVIFADDVITSGATAMAGYMALGDPDRYEVWTLVARPRLATKPRS